MNEEMIREIDGTNFAPGQLMVELMTGSLTVPVWIRFGHARHKITPENKDAVCKGLLLAIEMEGNLSANCQQER